MSSAHPPDVLISGSGICRAENLDVLEYFRQTDLQFGWGKAARVTGNQHMVSLARHARHA